MWFVRSWGEDVVCQELGEDVVWSEGEGRTVEDGGNEQFGVGSFPRVYICCIPDLCVIVLQQLLLSGNWYCVVCDVGVVARNCFDQVICSLVPLQACVPFYPMEGDRGGRPQFDYFPSSIDGQGMSRKLICDGQECCF